MGNKWEGLLTDKSSSGKPFWLETTITPRKDKIDNSIKYVATYHDVTKYQLQNIELLERNKTNAKYNAIFQATNRGIIVITDKDGIIIEWNKGAQLAFGYSKLEILGHPLTVLLSKKFRKGNIRDLEKFMNKVKNDKNTGIIEMSCLRKYGKEFPVEFALSSLTVDHQGFYCAIMLDISKRKNVEDRLKQKAKDTGMLLNCLTQDLKGSFSYGNQLVALLKNEKTSSKVTILADNLETELNRSKMVIDYLAHSTTISTEKKELKKIDFDKIITHVLKGFSGSKNFNLFKFNIDIIDNHNYLSKPELITAIFQNLIQNALLNFKESSNMIIPRIDISIKYLQDKIEIKVCNNGPEIDKKETNKLFNSRYKLEDKSNPENGLSLCIVKNIVEDLNGKIRAKNDVNHSTCFEIVLPKLV
jgi:PAS domain S-box-containing protein